MIAKRLPFSMVDPLVTIAAFCFIVIHSPDGKDETYVDSSHIFMVRPLQKQHEQHVAAGTRTILYVDGQKVGVHETPEEIAAMINECQGKQK